jgi:hypothetical protein
MLLYPLQEAVELLTSKLGLAKKSLDETVEDLEWIREQVTVMEVNFARVHNVSRPRVIISTSIHADSCYSGTLSGMFLRPSASSQCFRADP